jgi:hypothetical protein
MIDDGLIADIRSSRRSLPTSPNVVEANGRLLVPGFIDVHHHTEYILGDSVTSGGGFITHLSMHADSIAEYRERFAAEYLPYGVTTVRDMGSSEEDMPMLLNWMEPSPSAPDFYPVGGALVSQEDDRLPPASHSVVRDSADAAGKVRELHGLGIRHIKLYWRLRLPELKGALYEAQALGLNVTGHIDYHVAPLNTVIDVGLRSLEHAYTVGVGAMNEEEFVQVWRSARQLLGQTDDGLFYVGVMEYFNHLGRGNEAVHGLIDRLGVTGSTVVPTLHLFAQRFGLTYFTTPSVGAFDRTEGLSSQQLERSVAGYRILADYVKQMYDRGIRLAIGTDWMDPGKAVLSEMLLLHELGIPMVEVLRIATLNGAEAMSIDDSVGSVEVGKRANLVLLDYEVLDEPDLLLAEKLVIKDGRIWNDSGQSQDH